MERVVGIDTMNIVLCALADRTEAAARHVLHGGGETFFTAVDVCAAFRELRTRPASLVILGGDSREAAAASCRELRAAENGRDAVVVVVDVGGGLPDVCALVDAGADDVLVESSGEDMFHCRLVVARRTALAVATRRAAEQDREHLFRLSAPLSCTAGFDGYFKVMSSGWTDLLGWSSVELLSKPCLEFVHPGDWALTMAASARLARGEAVLDFTNRYASANGTYHSLEWRSDAVVERAIVYSAVRDVTEGRRTLAALRDLSEGLSTTLDSIGDGVIATSATGGIVRMNPVAQHLTGWTLAEARGRAPREVLHIIDGERRMPVENPIERVLREGGVVKLPRNTLLVRRDCTELPIADSCAPITGGDGAASGAVLVFRDLTAQCAAEATRALLQKQLVFADRMASVGTLAAGVAHEMNNPLSYVSSNVALALEEVLSICGGSPSGRMKELETMLLEARDGVARVTRIVRGLKAFSRVEEERRAAVDLVAVVELAVAMAFNEIRPRARLVKDYGSIPIVDGDDARLGQVFINLLVNAAHSFQNGESDANEIRVVTSTDAEGRAVVEVRDNGPGIPAAVLGRIFDPFFTTKPVGVGTGLGLAISHSLVTGAGGTLSVQSEVGKGATFRVVLPPSLTSKSSAPPPAVLPEAVPARRAAILVVDDEPALGSSIRRVLRHHDVTAVVTAKHALALIGGGAHFDMVLSDLMMPGMSGMEFYAELCRLHPELARRVVFLTGGAFTPESNAFLDRVPNRRMDKPFDPRALREMVEEFSKDVAPPIASLLSRSVEPVSRAGGEGCSGPLLRPQNSAGSE